MVGRTAHACGRRSFSAAHTLTLVRAILGGVCLAATLGIAGCSDRTSRVVASETSLGQIEAPEVPFGDEFARAGIPHPTRLRFPGLQTIAWTGANRSVQCIVVDAPGLTSSRAHSVSKTCLPLRIARTDGIYITVWPWRNVGKHYVAIFGVLPKGVRDPRVLGSGEVHKLNLRRDGAFGVLVYRPETLTFRHPSVGVRRVPVATALPPEAGPARSRRKMLSERRCPPSRLESPLADRRC